MLKDLMTLVGLPVAVVAIAVIAFSFLDTRHPIEVVEVVETPAPESTWIPQAIYIQNCDGETIAILVTTEPMQVATKSKPGTPEMEALVTAAREANLAYHFDIACSA